MATVTSVHPVAPPSGSPPTPASVAPQQQSLQFRQFTVEEYHLMAKAGVFVDGAPFELLEGWIVKKMTRNTPHDVTIAILTRLFAAKLPPAWDLRVQLAITTTDSEPEPDLVLARGQSRDYLPHHPYPADIGLLIEVADTTLDHDRTVKGRIYARAGVPVYWIVNLVDRRVEVYTSPSGPAALPAYQQLQTFRQGDAVPFVLDGQPVALLAVNDLLA